MNIRSKNKGQINRKTILVLLLVMAFLGAFFGLAIQSCFEVMGIAILQNVSICMIVYIFICIIFWLPLVIPVDQIMEIDEQTVWIIPKYSSWKKMKIAWYALINNNIKPFYRSIPLNEITKIEFTLDAHWGAYAYQRFCFMLRFHVGGEVIVVFINPGQNGPIMPSGQGLPFCGVLNRLEIANLIEYFKLHKILVEDPYKLEDALKDESVVLYDYLVSLHKKITF